MNDWPVVWLGTMAVALVVMAVVQVAVVVVALRVTRELTQTSQELRREIKPLIEKANRISDDAAKATALAVTQVERVDRLLAATSQRVDDTLAIVQAAVIEPVRTGAALFAAVKAVVGGLTGSPDHHQRHRHEDEDAMFVG